MSGSDQTPVTPPVPSVDRTLLAMLTASTGACVANLYLAQPLVPYIARDLGIAPGVAGIIVSASQFGYGFGLFLVVPLADAVENRRLVLACMALVIVGLVGLATAANAAVFLICGLLTGIFSCAAQILIPYLSRLLHDATRGRVLGIMSAGVLTTVMLARPLALFVTAWLGWRAIYWVAAAVATMLALGLARIMPAYRPSTRMRYATTIGSMFTAYRAAPGVGHSTLFQAMIFTSFTMFWAVVPIVLSERFAMSPAQIGVFALVGAGGAIIAPLSGRFADAGGARLGMGIATLVIATSFLVSIWAVEALLIALLAVGTLLFDAAVQASQTFNRLVVLGVDPAVRGRVNALYMTAVYLSGAVGSIVGVFLYVSFGWSAVAALGAAFAVTAFAGTWRAGSGTARLR